MKAKGSMNLPCQKVSGQYRIRAGKSTPRYYEVEFDRYPLACYQVYATWAMKNGLGFVRLF